MRDLLMENPCQHLITSEFEVKDRKFIYIDNDVSSLDMQLYYNGHQVDRSDPYGIFSATYGSMVDMGYGAKISFFKSRQFDNMVYKVRYSSKSSVCPRCHGNNASVGLKFNQLGVYDFALYPKHILQHLLYQFIIPLGSHPFYTNFGSTIRSFIGEKSVFVITPTQEVSRIIRFYSQNRFDYSRRTKESYIPVQAQDIQMQQVLAEDHPLTRSALVLFVQLNIVNLEFGVTL